MVAAPGQGDGPGMAGSDRKPGGADTPRSRGGDSEAKADLCPHKFLMSYVADVHQEGDAATRCGLLAPLEHA